MIAVLVLKCENITSVAKKNETSAEKWYGLVQGCVNLGEKIK